MVGICVRAYQFYFVGGHDHPKGHSLLLNPMTAHLYVGVRPLQESNGATLCVWRPQAKGGRRGWSYSQIAWCPFHLGCQASAPSPCAQGVHSSSHPRWDHGSPCRKGVATCSAVRTQGGSVLCKQGCTARPIGFARVCKWAPKESVCAIQETHTRTKLCGASSSLLPSMACAQGVRPAWKCMEFAYFKFGV